MLGKIEGKRRRGKQRMRCLDRITNSIDMNFSKLQEMVKYRRVWHVLSVGSQRTGHDLVTEQQQQQTEKEHGNVIFEFCISNLVIIIVLFKEMENTDKSELSA